MNCTGSQACHGLSTLQCSAASSPVPNNYGRFGATVKKMSALAPSLVASTCQAPSGSRSTLAAGLPLLNKSHDAERRCPSRDADQLGIARRLVLMSRHLHRHLHIHLSIAGTGRLVVLGSCVRLI